ncbi:MAG: DegV family protein [bacterium]|nr:DegV family protein [bacterium]
MKKALARGTERVAAWADLLDRINVFPLADGDTGRNLVISLLPLGADVKKPEETINLLLLSARGNSGNIAAQFFRGFLDPGPRSSFPEAVRRGREKAWQAVADPQPGTILSLLDALAEETDRHYRAGGWQWTGPVLDRLERTVRETADMIPALSRAGVVDAGALGMFIFLDGFFQSLAGREGGYRRIAEVFKEKISIDSAWRAEVSGGSCIDAVIRVPGKGGLPIGRISELSESLVSTSSGDYLKIHLHAGDQQQIRSRLAEWGRIVTWHADDLKAQTEKFTAARPEQAIHIVTDCAGSVSREDGLDLNMTLLDSYLTVGTAAFPESYVAPEDLYAEMRKGTRVATSQASVFERNQHYEKILSLHPRALYLCVGSVFTGNYQAVMKWKQEHDPEDRLTVVDSQAASGRLGLMAIAAARRARKSRDAEEVIAFARQMVDACEEYIFLDTLHYVAAGGRLSKTRAFFGDILRLKPVVSPRADGARKVGVAHNQKEQIQYALEKLKDRPPASAPALIMLEYTDNEEWVKGEIREKVKDRCPRAEILVKPFSLTSGAHMGPGTWGLAFLPGDEAGPR